MADSQQPTTLTGLAAKISEMTASLTSQLKEANIPEPTLSADSPTSYAGASAELFMLRQGLLDHLMDMWYLTQGPTESVFNYCHTAIPDAAVLNILNRFNFWTAVPLDGDASVSHIAAATELPADAVQRILEHAVTLRFFEFLAPGKSSGRVRHTMRSAALYKAPGLRALVTTIMDDAGPPLTMMAEALDRHVKGQPKVPSDMSKTAFTLLHGGKYTNSWDYIENDGEGERKGWRQRNFVEFMAFLKEIFMLDGMVADAYDWAGAGEGATVVDLGGSGGHDAFVLSEKFPNLRITVQDLPEAGPKFKEHAPRELVDSGRVAFMPHNFFEPQPLKADVFLIKLILHDWPDAESVRILKGLVPAMRPGSRVIFLDYVGKQEGAADGPVMPRHIQAMGTATDMRMMALFANEERPAEAWQALFRQADERFEITRVKADPLTFMCVIEAVWKE